jgi:Zn-dependent protease
MSSELNLVQTIAVWALPVLFAITLHEVAHGWVAKAFGDRTAESMGRLSLNPIRHVDPVGTIIVPAVLLVLGGFLFGWAKPVPVNYANLRHPKRDMAIVAAAGPVSNFVMGLGWAIVLKLTTLVSAESGIVLGLRYMAQAGITINAVLMVLNLLPLPPLDGGRVMAGLLPTRAAIAFSRIEPYGLLILVALMVSGVLGRILHPPLLLVQGLLCGMVGLSCGA